MNVSTEGIVLQTRRRWLSDVVELLSSMRFSISLLTVIAIASVIGTVVTQNEPMPNYVNQFGPFWSDILGRFSIYSVYAAWWFLLIMAFLVTSTSLCIARNAPKMIADMKSWRESVREQSLRNFHHRVEWSSANTREAIAQEVGRKVAAKGYQWKLVEKDGATLLTAKQGAANKLGYIFAHSAIVIICIGGLLDSNIPIGIQQWLYDKSPFIGNGIIAEVPAKHRLGLGNPSFRGNTFVPEGASSNTAIIPVGEGVMIQELPFTLQLKKFVIDFYATGMPKLFASEVLVTDHETGKTFPATIKVNEPLIYKGMAVYQSSFEDGGSHLKLLGYPMKGPNNQQFQVEGDVGRSTPLLGSTGSEYVIECDGLANDLQQDGFSAVALHGALSQAVRNRRLMALRQGQVQILVATDVAARGIDVPTITHVFNFGLPMKAEDYTHRIGRTGRAGRDGLAITFAEFRDRR